MCCLKPLWERALLFYLSRAIFDDAPGILETIKHWPKTILPQWLPSLTWRRLSATRSMDLPTLQLESLKGTHKAWIESLFTGPYDHDYTAKMFHVGDVHVKVNLPVEFMAGGITIIGNALLPVVAKICGADHERCVKANSAINAVLGFSLMIMQESYQASSLAAELEKFLSITGMSRKLFDNLAEAYTN